MSGMRVIGAGLKSLEDRLDVISGNLANANTPGYRRSMAVAQLFETYLGGAFGSKGPRVPGQTTRIDFTRGDITHTGNVLDVAIQDRGFFEIKLDDGSFGYTRAGRFTRNPESQLTTTSGLIVSGEDGVIDVPATGEIGIAPDGTINVDGKRTGRIKIVDFARLDQLTRGSRGTFAAPPEAVLETVENPKLLQGSYEGSNVRATKELIGLIEAQRSYERKNRAIKLIGEASTALIRAAQGV